MVPIALLVVIVVIVVIVIFAVYALLKYPLRLLRDRRVRKRFYAGLEKNLNDYNDERLRRKLFSELGKQQKIIKKRIQYKRLNTPTRMDRQKRRIIQNRKDKLRRIINHFESDARVDSRTVNYALKNKDLADAIDEVDVASEADVIALDSNVYDFFQDELKNMNIL